MIENPQGYTVFEECRKAANQNGYRRDLGQVEGWARFESTTAQGMIALAAAGPDGPWFLALDHPGVIEELKLPAIDLSGPGQARLQFVHLNELYHVLDNVYALAVSLPDNPLRTFQAKTQSLPQTTEAERLVVQRVGQDIFRGSLMDYWRKCCPLTGITEPALLRASHIIPWAKCDDDAERLNVHNGLLLSALWDAAFDKGLVTFEDDGQPRFSPALTEPARAALIFLGPIPLTDHHRQRLAWHRANVFQSSS